MRIRRCLVALAVLALFLGGPGAANAADPEQVKKRIEQAFGVKVLRISRVKRGKQQLYVVRTLTQAAAHNDSWQVNELLVEPKSGALVPTFQHRTSGYGFDGPADGDIPKTAAPRLIRVPLPPFKRSVRVVETAAAKKAKAAKKKPAAKR